MTAFSTANATYCYLDLLRGGATLTVFTKGRGAGARTNKVATLEKEPGVWGDWQVTHRPTTADPSLLPETWHESSGVISTRTLADTFDGNSDLWAEVNE